MKKFIKYTTIFSLPILILMVLFEVLLRNIPNEYSYKSNYLDHNSDKIQALFLGNSHIFYGINPELISLNGFNASHVAQSLDLDYEILKKHENNWKNLKYIVVSVDYMSLLSSIQDGPAEWRLMNYKIYYDIHIRNKFTDNFEMFNGKLAKNTRRIFNYYIKHQGSININTLGWGTQLNSSKNKDLLKTGKIAAARHAAKNEITFNKLISNLESIIMFAKNNKIKIILISCPSYKTYSENLNKKELASTVNVVNALDDKYSNMRYFNLLQDKSFDAKDFFDADHLNEIGAKKFTVKIDSIMKTMENH